MEASRQFEVTSISVRFKTNAIHPLANGLFEPLAKFFELRSKLL